MNFKKITILGLAVGMQLATFAQAPITQKRNAILAKTPEERLQILQENFIIEQKELNETLAKSGQPRTMVSANGNFMEAKFLSNGLPVYVQTLNNTDAAKTISTNKVQPGGSLGLSLTGSGMTNRLGVWDGGAVLLTHQEFQSRAVQSDNPSSTSDHATHVAGTMVAGGVVANARGMSYQAPIKCYDWNSDDGEMGAAAAAGMLVSNHSYGQVGGWQWISGSSWRFWGDQSLSTEFDSKYGFYDNNSEVFDQLLVDYPFYLPFMAAGNDRGNGPSGNFTWQVRNSNGQWVNGTGTPPGKIGPYDCMSGGPANAKNVMTVGAVNPILNGWTGASGVVMSSFSGWGPTDDGRIKPDIVANGVDVYSAGSSSNTNYTTKDGTSMATPNASGSALLIQQHHNNVKGKFMRASTLKGLIIHTADEAGSNPGPDYSFGWGLMNTAKAVQMINDSVSQRISEMVLANAGTYTLSFYADGTKPIRATICWTDKPGISPNPALNPANIMLVNDLDIRVKRNSDNTIYFPWKLNKATPAAAATNGDNNVDNVEQILINAPVAGTYTITISHKGTLSGSQPYSFFLSGLTPKPSASFTTANRNVCANTSITFQDQSAGAAQRTWYFPGGVPAFSTLLNPSVTYSAPGVYPVALAIKSSVGYDSIYLNDYITVGGMGLPFNETFEVNSTTRQLWSVQNFDNDSTWRFWNIAGNTPGNIAVGINNYDNPTFGSYDRLISPVLDLRGYSAATMTFQHAYTRYDNTISDSLNVYVSTNCGNTWTRLGNYAENGTGNFATGPNGTFETTDPFIPSSAANWCGGGVGANCFSYNLTPYVGNFNVRVRFEQIGYGGNNMFIDNVQITGTLNAAPIAGFKAVQSTVCANSNVQFLDSSRNQVAEWAWYVNGVLKSNQRNPIIKFTDAGTYAVALAVKNAIGKDSIYKASFITVNAGPAKPVVNSSKGLSLCNGDSTVINTTAISSFIWFKDSLAQTLSATSFITKEAGKYFIRTYDAGGCYSQSDVLDIKAGITPAKPTITKNLTGSVFCDGGTFVLTSSAELNNQWYRNGELINGQTAKQLSFTDSGSFAVSTNNNGCTNTSDVIRIDKLPRPNTSEIIGKPWAVKGDTVTFRVNGSVGSTFAWTASSATILSVNGKDSIRVRTNPAGGVATLTVQETGSNNCKGLMKTLEVGLVNTGLSLFDAIMNFNVYPNPAKESLKLDFKINGTHDIKVSVFNMLGQSVMEANWTNIQGTQHKELAINNLENGFYVVRLESNGKQITKSFIKSN